MKRLDVARAAAVAVIALAVAGDVEGSAVFLSLTRALTALSRRMKAVMDDTSPNGLRRRARSECLESQCRSARQQRPQRTAYQTRNRLQRLA